MHSDRTDSIEVFQYLFLVCAEKRRAELCKALRSGASSPWRHAGERERELARASSVAADFLAFDRRSGDGIAASGLTLREQPDGYNVANIFPLENGDLSVSRYNDVLNDFLDRVVNPALTDSDVEVKVTPRRQTITDWTSSAAASALHTFSACANKSTGTGHPADQERWFKFLFAAYDTDSRLDTDLLGRWLVEVEDWPPEMAEHLTDEYRYSMDLLRSRAGS